MRTATVRRRRARNAALLCGLRLPNTSTSNVGTRRCFYYYEIMIVVSIFFFILGGPPPPLYDRTHRRTAHRGHLATIATDWLPCVRAPCAYLHHSATMGTVATEVVPNPFRAHTRARRRRQCQ